MKTQIAEALAKGLKGLIIAVISIIIGKNGYDKWNEGRNPKA